LVFADFASFCDESKSGSGVEQKAAKSALKTVECKRQRVSNLSIDSCSCSSFFIALAKPVAHSGEASEF
jgi:hypothetical protein